MALASAPAQSRIWHRASPHLRAALSVCTSHNAELSLLEKDREFFLVLLSTVHIICPLTGLYLFFLVAFQAGDHFNKLHHHRI